MNPIYLDDIASAIRGHVPESRLPTGNATPLLRLYAVLLRVKGQNVTSSDVHDVWSAWMAERDADHASLVPYDDLPKDIQEEDQVFVSAIQAAYDEVGQPGDSRPLFSEILFPSGPPRGDAASRQTFDLYKLMVQSSESLVSRRQGVNTFFLTINGALLTAIGLIVQNSGDVRLSSLGILVLAIAAALLCGAWRSLITSFGQLNRGKFAVINAIERYLSAAVYAAEWEALGRGEDPNIYRTFTSREIWVPNALMGLHVLTALSSLTVFLVAVLSS